MKKGKLLIEQVNDNSNDLKCLIQAFIDKYENEKYEFKDEIEKFIKLLEEYDKTNNNYNYKNILNIQNSKLKDFCDLTSNICINISYDEIKEYNNKLKIIFDSFTDFEFMPPNINNLYNSSNNFLCNSFENKKEDQLYNFSKQNDSNLSFKEFDITYQNDINLILEGFKSDEREKLKKTNDEINADLNELHYIKDNLIIYHKEFYYNIIKK